VVPQILFLKEWRKQPNQILAHFVLTLQTRMEMAAIVNKCVIQKPRLYIDSVSEFFHALHQAIESALRLGQRPTGPRRDNQRSLLMLRHFGFEQEPLRFWHGYLPAVICCMERFMMARAMDGYGPHGFPDNRNAPI